MSPKEGGFILEDEQFILGPRIQGDKGGQSPGCDNFYLIVRL